jgi:hypothetical protein
MTTSSATSNRINCFTAALYADSDESSTIRREYRPYHEVTTGGGLDAKKKPGVLEPKNSAVESNHCSRNSRESRTRGKSRKEQVG